VNAQSANYTPPDTVWVFLEAILAANDLTDTYKTKQQEITQINTTL